MPVKLATAKPERHEPVRRRETQSLLNLFNQRMISDFEDETRDFAFLCLVASAHGLGGWPEGKPLADEEGRFLTFH